MQSSFSGLVIMLDFSVRPDAVSRACWVDDLVHSYGNRRRNWRPGSSRSSTTAQLVSFGRVLPHRSDLSPFYKVRILLTVLLVRTSVPSLARLAAGLCMPTSFERLCFRDRHHIAQCGTSPQNGMAVRYGVFSTLRQYATAADLLSSASL